MLTLVKCGGAALARGSFALERYVEEGSGVCVVHGAGPRISADMREVGLEPLFAGGRRVTTAEALPIVREAFRRENEELCRQIGPRAHGLMGDDLGLEADVLEELGHVGVLRPVVPAVLWRLLAEGFVPVIAPLARGPLNVNADDAAAALAVALGADRLVFVSDVPGVLLGGEVALRLSAGEIAGLGGELTDGIVPKLQAAVRAARAGVRAEVGATLVTA
jgi:acetylglutamate kinase